MKYLITGGAGFIGVNLAQKLSENKKNKIYLMDNLSKDINNKKFSELIKNKNIIFLKKDLSNKASYPNIFNFDYIFHFAAILGVKTVIDNPFITLKENIKTSINLIDFSKKQKKLKKLCFTSTSEVYAYTLENKLARYPTPENIDFIISKDFNPRSAYLLSKIVVEYLINYSRLNFVIFRPHNIFGPDMGFSHVIPQLTKKILNKKRKNILVNNSNHKRTFCYIDFAIDLIVKISHDKKSTKKIYNIGSPDKDISILQLAKKISKILRLKKKLLPSKKLKDNSPKKRRPDMNKSLNYIKTKHNFEEGLKETVLWYKKYYQN
mgnify:CR=1 FL=1